MNGKLIGAIIVALILICASYSYLTEPDKLKVEVGGSTIDDGLVPGIVTGFIEDEEYSSQRDAFILSPGQKVTINIWIYNERDTVNNYKVWVYDYDSIWTSEDVLLNPGYTDEKEWTFSYTAPSTEGKTTIFVESGYKLGPALPTYQFDDLMSFDIIVEKDAPPDPCEDFKCPNDCDDEYFLYNGYCISSGGEAKCQYERELVDGKCGYVLDLCEGVPCTKECDEEYSLSDGKCTVVNDKATCKYTRELIDGKCGYVGDLCDGFPCTETCDDPYSLSDGKCVIEDGKPVCEYTKTEIDGKCGYEEPVDDPCDGFPCTEECEDTYSLSDGHCIVEDGNPVCEYTKTEINGICGFTEEPEPEPCESYCDDPYYHHNGEWDGTNCVYVVEKIDKFCNFTLECTNDPDCVSGCVDPQTYRHDGVCVNDSCEYIEDAMSPECGYVTPAVSPPSGGGGGGGGSSSTTATPTPTASPTNDSETSEPYDIPYGTILIVAFVLGLVGYLYTQKDIFK